MKNRIRQETAGEKNEIEKRREELDTLKKRLSRMERILTKLRVELGTLRKIYSEILDPRIRELDDLKGTLLKSPDSGRSHNTGHEASPAGFFSFHRESEDYEDPSCFDGRIVEDPVDSFKDLYRKVAKAVHPDLSANEEERKWRQKLMAEANNAYTRKDYESLRSILRQWENGPDTRTGEDMSAELSLILRKISWTKERIRSVEAEIEALKDSDLYRLLVRVEEAQNAGVDLLAEMAKKIDKDIASIRIRLRGTPSERDDNITAGKNPCELQRLVRFPSARPAGKLYCRKSGSESFLDWRYHGEARGEVGIPVGSSLRLDIREEKGFSLSFLEALGENDLQALFLHDSTDRELSCLWRLPGLRELYLSGKGITDAGIFRLRKLKNLHRLYLYETAITDKGAEALRGLGGLRCITFCGTCITEDVMRKIKNFLPACRIILLNRPSDETG